MCGIVGFWNLNGEPVSDEILVKFIDSLSHRGPDGRGTFVDSNTAVALAQRRLAILDTTDTGRQPMSYAGGRYWITYNGEIYNFLELKVELEGYGYQFTTASDTEVILAAYDRWGQDCQERMNGMWAFAIWDSRDQLLFISRDRFGVKPMHYLHDNSRFAFASEMKAFLALGWFRLEFDPEMVAAALTDMENIEGTENCLLRGLKRLQGGHCLTVNNKGEVIKRRWWNTLDHLEDRKLSYESQVKEFKELFLDACRIRMRSDVPIGTALSGGLDSSSIVCGMKHIRRDDRSGERLAGDWQRAFVATYPGNIIDEKKYADEVIKSTGAKPIYCPITPDMYIQYFEQILFQYEEISDIYLGPWLVHKTQRENGIVVTLDGHGGDEMLGGYPWHITSALRDSLKKFSPRRTLELLKTMRGLELFPGNSFYLSSLKSLARKWLNSANDSKSQGWLNIKPAKFYSPAYEADQSRLTERDDLFRRLYIDFHHTQLPMNLRDFDRLSMAHGVEVRSPFMDWRLVCFTFSLPSDSKIRDGYTKQILRDSLKGILPEPIRLRTRKLGFPNMQESWSSPRASEFIHDMINTSDFQDSQVWNGRTIRKDLERAYQDRDYTQIHAAWTYVQAMCLIKMFREKRNLLE